MSKKHQLDHLTRREALAALSRCRSAWKRDSRIKNEEIARLTDLLEQCIECGPGVSDVREWIRAREIGGGDE